MFSLIWAVLCAVASGLFSEVLFKLQEDNWDESKDEHIQWRYQHAQAAVVRSVLIPIIQLSKYLARKKLLVKSSSLCWTFKASLLVRLSVPICLRNREGPFIPCVIPSRLSREYAPGIP